MTEPRRSQNEKPLHQGAFCFCCHSYLNANLGREHVFCSIGNLAGCEYSYFNCWMTYMFLMTKLKYVFSRISVADGFNKYQTFVSVSHYGHQLWSGHRRQHLHDLIVFHPLFFPYSPAPPQPVPGAAFGFSHLCICTLQLGSERVKGQTSPVSSVSASCGPLAVLNFA